MQTLKEYNARLKEELAEQGDRLRSVTEALSETKAQLSMETEMGDKIKSGKLMAEASIEELRRLILAEQQERNAVLLENERLVADFEQLRMKVKETIEVQETQKAMSKEVV